ncbi:PAS domain-containing protein [Vibrio pectenicida]|uniref:PAS domain-containing protein n=1 Tax=Vibrio pectenicida TaxID=62763 RepID=A0A7Y3ZZY0_9VIBR|nr:PAS domain-containing protein [Vibrio pectenicida]NOH71574.1 PAS domain-containing protein [Vibrio pectenicida]
MKKTNKGFDTESALYESVYNAIIRSQGVIEFELDGTIYNANQNFLDVVGYTLDEIKGQHHRMFVSPAYAKTRAYKDFWNKLGKGEFDAGQYKRVSKSGQDIYLQASYNPVFDENGDPIRVIKVASDITANKLASLKFSSQISAIDKSLATIEFNMDGTVITANKNFLDLMGYSLDEIVGKHHRIFCEEDYRQSLEYSQFWDELGKGEFSSGEYIRMTKNGQMVFIQATYNPVFDEQGKPIKVFKVASDITEYRLQSNEANSKGDAIDKSLGTIEFNLDGTVITANQNFLDLMGYSLEEIQGKHHRLFCEPEYTETEQYREFWHELGLGQFNSGEFKRIAKNGREIYIQATYNPVLDLKGKPYKVLKVASDITDRKKMSEERSKQASMIMEMSTPVMQLWDRVLMLPVIGLIDSNRIQMIMEAVLQKVIDFEARVIVIDIQGVPTVDSAVANHLLKVAKATRLMGCLCIVTGISPVVAQAIVNLGIELNDVVTQSTLKEGVSNSFRIAGYTLTQNDEHQESWHE